MVYKCLCLLGRYTQHVNQNGYLSINWSVKHAKPIAALRRFCELSQTALLWIFFKAIDFPLQEQVLTALFGNANHMSVKYQIFRKRDTPIDL